MFALRLESCDAEQADEFLEELYAPLDPREIKAERDAMRWIKGG